MTKLKAFATHIGISLVIFFAVLSFILYFWYPAPFFADDGGWQGIRIIAAVDVVLGPLLTLIVYKPGKPYLKVDLTIIALIQTGALAWGIWVVHFERPIAAVFTESFFTSVKASDLKIKGISEKELKAYGKRTPVWIYSDLPDSINDMQKIRIESLKSGKSISLFTEYYKPIDDNIRQKLIKKSINLAKWVKDKPADKRIYHDFIEEHKSDMENIIFYPWHARFAWKIIALKKNDLSYVGTLNILPPKAEETVD
jgi:hypothetical protein